MGERLNIKISDDISDKWLVNHSLAWIRGQLDSDTTTRLDAVLRGRLREQGTSWLLTELTLTVLEHLARTSRRRARDA